MGANGMGLNNGAALGEKGEHSVSTVVLGFCADLCARSDRNTCLLRSTLAPPLFLLILRPLTQSYDHLLPSVRQGRKCWGVSPGRVIRDRYMEAEKARSLERGRVLRTEQCSIPSLTNSMYGAATFTARLSPLTIGHSVHKDKQTT
jgi:hypothetical protein